MAIFRVDYIEPDGVTGRIIVDAENLAEARIKAAASPNLPPGARVQGVPEAIAPSEGMDEQTSIVGLFSDKPVMTLVDDPPPTPPTTVVPPTPKKTYKGVVLPDFFQDDEQYRQFMQELSEDRRDLIIENGLQNFIELNNFENLLRGGEPGGSQGGPGGVSTEEALANFLASNSIDPDKIKITDDGGVVLEPGFTIDDTEKERFLEGISGFGAFARGLEGTPLEGLRERGGFARRFAESQYEPAYTSYLGSQILPFITGSGLSEGAAAQLNTNDETLNTALKKRLSGKPLSDTEAAALAAYDSVSNQPQTFSAFTRQFLGQGPEATRRNLLDQFRQAALMDQAATGIGREFTTPSSQETASKIEDFARASFLSQYSPIISGALQAALPTANFADYAAQSMGFGGQPIEQPNFLKFIGSRYGLI
jgi:hypothetical protein